MSERNMNTSLLCTKVFIGNYSILFSRICPFDALDENRRSSIFYVFFGGDQKETTPAVTGGAFQKGDFKSSAKFTGKQLCQSLFFNKVFYRKKRLWKRCFPVNFSKFLETSILNNIYKRLLLEQRKEMS